MEKIKAFYKAHKVKGLLSIIFVLLWHILSPQSVGVISDSIDVVKDLKTITQKKEVPETIINNIEKKKKTEPKVINVVKKVEEKTKSLDSCKPTYLLKTDDVLKRGNFIILDLNTFEKTSEVTKNGETTTKYRRFGSLKQYYTVTTRAIKAK